MMLPDGMTPQQLFDETLSYYRNGGLPGTRREGDGPWHSWYRTGAAESAGQPVGPACLIGRQIPDDLYQQAAEAPAIEGTGIGPLLAGNRQLARRFLHCPLPFLADLQAAHDSIIAGLPAAGIEPLAWQRQIVALLLLVARRHHLARPE